MKKIVIKGNKPLTGTVSISGAKNSVVALIPASILTSEVVEINNVPKLSDTVNLERIINLLGGEIKFEKDKLRINGKNVTSKPIPEEFSNKLRASYYFMGALLGRYKHVEINFPGGCNIGKRPIDQHLKGFKRLGATVIKDKDKYIIDAKELRGNHIYLDFPSVGATVNILLASVLAKGTTIIENAAKEPEISNLILLLNNMGAKISGENTSTLKIKGVKKLHKAKVRVIPDRIEAGTYAMIGAVIGENFKIDNIIPEHIMSLISIFKDMKVDFKVGRNYMIVNKSKLLPTNIITSVYPGFPTDLGQPMTVLLTQCEGNSRFKETIYENRMGQIPELVKMGANITSSNINAKIIAPTKLTGKEVTATDLRAGAALIIAGLIAKGETKISNIDHILRGYEDIVNKLTSVGADIKIVEE